jgi:erythromycin esterase
LRPEIAMLAHCSNRPFRHRRDCVALATLVLVVATACHSAPPPPPAPPPALSDSAAAALRWIESHTAALSLIDSTPRASERDALAGIAGDARIIGLSELTEGTHEFPLIVRKTLFGLADTLHVRGLAIQAPMAEALEVDRFVRTGTGDPRRLVRTLGSWRWETPEMLALIQAIRTWNRSHTGDAQLGFYGFEIPSAAHAVQVVTSIPDSIAGAPLNAWLRREYACVAMNEGAHWGLEGRAADSTFWNRCGVVAKQGVDSIVALRARVSSARAANLAFAEQMARLIRHHVDVGLRHVSRQEGNAEHVLYLANSLGPDAKLVLWGGDVEMGRLTLDRNTVQTGVPLGEKLGERYRSIAFLIGDGTIRARSPAVGRGGEQSGLRSVTVARPTPETYEDPMSRVALEAWWLDMRSLPSDAGGKWLQGPHQARLITEVYAPEAPQLFLTPLEFPKYYDAVVFVRHVSATR